MQKMDNNEKTALGILFIGGVGAGILLLSKKKPQNEDTPLEPLPIPPVEPPVVIIPNGQDSLNITTYPFGDITTVVFSAEILGLNLNGGLQIPFNPDNFFSKFSDWNVEKQKIIQNWQHITLGTSTPWRGRWIYFDGSKWYYVSTDGL